MMEPTRPYLKFERDTEEGRILRTWWSGLEHNKGDRAELRRADSLAEISFAPAYHRLYQDLRETAPVNKRSLATVASILAHVRQDEPGHGIAWRMASPKPGSDRAALSGLRFRRLLAIPDDDHETLRTQMIRVVRLLSNTVNLTDLANTVYWWNERTKTQLAYAYYDRAPRTEA